MHEKADNGAVARGHAAWGATALLPPIYAAAGTVALFTLVEALWRFGSRSVPNLGLLVLAAALLSAFAGGYRSGLISAFIALPYYAYAASQGPHLRYDRQTLARVVMTWVVTLTAVPLMAYLRGGLHHALLRERALRSETAVRLRQQAAVSALGMQALEGMPVPDLLDSAVELLHRTLGVDLVKVLELSPDLRSLKLRAGHGFRAGLVGSTEIPAAGGSQAAYTLSSEAPVIIDDLAADARFRGPGVLIEHGAVSGLSVIIKGEERPFGVLGVHTTTRRAFTAHDVHFVQSVANVLAQTLALRSAHERVEESESRFRDLADNVDDVFWVSDEASGRVVYANTAFERLWGASRESLYADRDTWLNAVHPDDLDVARELQRPAMGRSYELRVVRPDGSVRWASARVFRVPRDGDTRLVGVTRDVTEARQAAESDRALAGERTARAAAEASVRARDEALAVVSHDLRGPLTSIALSLTRLKAAWPRAAAVDVTRPFSALDRAVRQMSRLTDDLLEVSRIEAGRLSLALAPIELGPLLDEVREANAIMAEARGQTLTTAASPGPIAVLADRERVLQVFANLVGNAVKFTPEGGAITLCARVEGDRVVLSVSDTGPGIEAPELPHLFERYWQARERDRRGAGLGLAIVKGIVEAHGGEAWVESEPGKGATFCFTLERSPRSSP